MALSLRDLERLNFHHDLVDRRKDPLEAPRPLPLVLNRKREKFPVAAIQAKT
jgi:hypothetical protein